MPPRKRRQSAQGEEISKESNERVVSPSGIETEAAKQTKSTAKSSESANTVSEKRLSARQLSKQDAVAVGESAAASKVSKEPVSSTSAVEPTVKQPTRFSTRIVKRPRRDLSPPESPVKKGKKANVQPVITTPETKGKRQWELWSVEDKDSFFEGLCEFGKDFESIHNLIVNKCKKKGSVLPNITVKNKEQVRHFYYRTWHKISKLIEPVENLKKDIQELYGLVSYSVLRKKLRGGVNPNDKNWQKLNDLVHQGVATIKVKGKRIRVKTPVCNALKKLNSYEECRKESGQKVPEKIRVEFRPKTNQAWQHVQDLAHNPRVRVTVRSDRHLHSLVKYLDQKWKPHRLKLRESLGDPEVSRQEFRVFPHRNSTLRTISMEAIDEPTLQFCLNKHNKDTNYSPSTSKKKKDQCTSMKNNLDNVIDTSKSVIPELNCSCKETCTSCAFKEMKSCGFSNDLMKTCAGKDGILNCSCVCNIDKTTLTEIEKSGIDKAVGGATCLDGRKDSPARSLFGKSLEGGITQIPGNINESRCVMRQKDSPVCRSDEVSTSLPFARSISGQEVSAIADGENAMFPDSITKTCGEGLEDGTASDVEVKDEDVNSEDGRESLGFTNENALDGDLIKEEDNFTPNVSSQAEFEKMFKSMLDTGWNVKESESVTLAELYLMFGEDGEMKLEYEWISQKTEVDLRHERFLTNLNNILRRLSHLATIEFTDLKTPGSNSVCQSCGQSPNAKKSQGRGKDKSPPVPVKVTKGKDVSTQTQGLIFNPIPLGPGISTSSQNGVFRIPVLPAPLASQPKTTTTLVQPSKELLARYTSNTSTASTQKQLMRPRKLKHTSRSRPGSTGSLVQRTILPKNSEYITIIPMVPGTQIPNHSPDKGTVETIVGHPINGIQKHPINTPPSSPNIRNPVLAGSPAVTPTTLPQTPTSVPMNMVEMSLSPDGDQTLLRIPASHLSTMSQEALKAAGFSTMPGTPLSSTITLSMDESSSSLGISTSTPVSTSKCSTNVSPPNLSLLLDMSLPSGDIETDTNFSGLLDENSKTLTIDPVLTTPPIRSSTDTHKAVSMNSPPVRSLFRSSPTPDSQQWLAGDVNDLSLSSFLESPSKPSTSSTASMFNPNMPLSLFNENSREFHSHRMDVDTTFQSMMNESSIDYMKKFADLAEQITQYDPDHTKKPD